MAHRVRSAPRRPSIERHGASVPTRVHLPPQLRHTRVSHHCASAPGRRHPRAMDAAPAPDFHRLSGLTSLSGWLPTTPPQGGSHMAATIAPAPKRHQNYLLITLAAAALRADLAPRHYRIAPPGDMPRKTTSAASGRGSGSDGPCASDPRPANPRHSPGPSSATASQPGLVPPPPHCRSSFAAATTGSTWARERWNPRVVGPAAARIPNRRRAQPDRPLDCAIASSTRLRRA